MVAGMIIVKDGTYPRICADCHRRNRCTSPLQPRQQRPALMFDFEEALKLISDQTVLCVGDLMLDDFVYGEVARISPEAPTPVLAVTRSELVIGGAGNVARNVAGAWRSLHLCGRDRRR